MTKGSQCIASWPHTHNTQNKSIDHVLGPMSIVFGKRDQTNLVEATFPQEESRLMTMSISA